MKLVAIAGLLCLSLVCQSQDFLNEFTWDAKSWRSEVDSSSDEDVQILFRDRQHEFAYDAEGNLTEHYFFRSVVYLHTDKALEAYNKIYINTSNAIELLDHNAKVITKTDSEVLLGEEALKKGTSEDGQEFEYFAIEGAEEGAIVDYYYVLKKYPAYNGLRISIQTSDPVNNYRFRIISPLNLVFSVIPLNGDLTVYRDTVDTAHQIITAEASNIIGIKDEPFSNADGYSLGLVYKLRDNRSRNTYNMFTYGTVSQSIFEAFSAAGDKIIQKELKKFLKPIEFSDQLSEEEKIRLIEDYLKRNVTKVDKGAPELEQLSFILTNRVASERGMALLFYHAFALFNIETQIVLSCSRYDAYFPQDFENYAYLDDYLLYFPSIDQLTMPGAQLYRLGLLPYGFIDNYGLFIRKVEVGDVVTGAGKIKYIEPYDKNHSRHDMWIKASIKEDLSAAKIEMIEEMTGFNALNFQPFYDYVDGDGMEKLRKSSVKQVCETADIQSVEIENEGVSNIMKLPFRVKAEYENAEVVSLAGNKILFNIGQLIGPQAEMYQEEKRTLKVTNTHNHAYYREIEFIIPEGYRCANLADLEMNIDPFSDHHSFFTSIYELDGQTVKVKVTEDYDKIELPMEHFEDFRRVINAAADFNKKTLVLEKI